MGVELLLATRVARVAEDRVELDDGRTLPTWTVVWTGGVRGDVPRATSREPLTERGWIRVDEHLRVEGWPDVYAIGDVALTAGRRLPLVAPAANQQGTHCARQILREIRGEELEPFRYEDKGILGTIGRHTAYARIYGRPLTGFLAWLIWLVIHIQRLVGFRNRLVVGSRFGSWNRPGARTRHGGGLRCGRQLRSGRMTFSGVCISASGRTSYRA